MLNGSSYPEGAKSTGNPPPRLHLQVGGFYRRRDGAIVGPVAESSSTAGMFEVAGPYGPLFYDAHGKLFAFEEFANREDLINRVIVTEEGTRP